ncbi:protein ENDOSPERM DEFECTIVE 1-like [Mercurialis annua]|uniref:protein ENDOSPERM DEFECTIVE 1-like n=1 Tax=Mercurialis annua TaxID=3986 RepID=UPI00215E50F0|nr:protein ENDOSPERM DEFECTIVE 1-like [Mercurialis annua]
MSESMVETERSKVCPPLPPPAQPPPTQRRPRVREVSSRFMTPPPPPPSSSFSTSPLPNSKHRSSSVHEQRQTESHSGSDENRDINIRSPTTKKRSVVKLFKEHGGGPPPPSTRSHRPDTPNVTTSSKLRLMHHRSNPNSSSATRLLRSSGISSSFSNLDLSNLSETSSPSSSPSSRSCSTTQSPPDLRSSMPEAPSGLLVERNINISSSNLCKPNASPCSRSLDFITSADKAAMKKMAGHPLPPVPPCANFTRKPSKKAHNHQDDVHSLRLLHNHYLQWRYANAKAELSIRAQRRETERTLYSLSRNISELYESVRPKRIELNLLRRSKALTTILEAQMPHLEEWSILEEEYSASFLEAIQAFQNISLRLPISGSVRVDVREVGEALNSAMQLMELIAFHVQSFMPKAEEMDSLVSELARVTGGERAIIEECGDLLFMTYKSQVEECSLRGQLIQLNQMISQSQTHSQQSLDELTIC